MESETFYNIQEEYKKNVIIKKVKLVENWIGYTIIIKIIDNNRIIKKHTMISSFITVPTEKELEKRVETEIEVYIYSRIKDKCADYVVKKYNKKL